MPTVPELKIAVQNFNMVDGISKLKKDELIVLLRNLRLYEQNRKNYNYWNYKFGKDDEITVNKQQYEVITSSMRDNIRIIACAGSGKTTTIICRIKYLIDHGVKPETIMLTTFNVDAAKNMEKKLLELFGFMPRIVIGTIDSIACKFYHKHFSKDYYVSVSEYSIELLKYLKSGRGSNILNSFSHLFFDEFQDASETQYEIVKCFNEAGARITVIGDDAQNIYQFRGSNVKFIIDLDKYVSKLITYKLIINYRSTPEIINMANSSIINNANQIKKDMVPINKTIDFKPHIEYFKSPKSEYISIIKKINKLMADGLPVGNIAILSRTNYPLKKVEELIEKYKQSGKTNIKYVSLIASETCDIKAKIKPNHLTITTIHKSKGLEWDAVFIIGCDDSNFPSDKTKLSLEEERRLFYVAVTRPKKHLYISFHSKNNQPTLISLFIQELPNDNYNFVNKDDKFYQLSTYSKTHWETGVTKIIQMFNEKDIAYLRKKNIIPSINPLTQDIHADHYYDDDIKSNNWEPDYGHFIDRYITRLIGYHNKESNGLIDDCANRIIHPCILTNQEESVYKKYYDNFKLNIDNIDSTTDPRYFANILNRGNRILGVTQIEGIDLVTIKKIVNSILAINKTYGIPMGDIHVTTERVLPKKFINSMTLAYGNFRNEQKKNCDTMEDIYKISLCGMICNGRRRLLYRKDAMGIFTADNPDMFDDIHGYVDEIKDNKLCTKLMVFSKLHSICGEIDLLDISEKKVVDFKCSESDNFQLEWMLQLLAYTALIRVGMPELKTEIETIEVYNPLRGLLFSFDVSEWDKHEKLLKYMDHVRCRQAMRVCDEESADSGDCDELEQKQLKIVNDCINKVRQYDSMKIFEDNEWFIRSSLESYHRNDTKDKNLFNIYKKYYDEHKLIPHILDDPKILYDISKIFKFKYLVLDTETIGLPKINKFNQFPYYKKLNKYDTARIVQISWAIYDNNDELMKTEDHIIKPNGFYVNPDSTKIHGISMSKAVNEGKDIKKALDIFMKDVNDVDIIVCHNVVFDINVIKSEMWRLKRRKDIETLSDIKSICTLEKAKKLQLQRKVKNCKLETLYRYYFNKEIENAHNSLYDVLNTGKVFAKLREDGLIVI